MLCQQNVWIKKTSTAKKEASNPSVKICHLTQNSRPTFYLYGFALFLPMFTLDPTTVHGWQQIFPTLHILTFLFVSRSHLKLLQPRCVFTHAGKLVDAVALEIKLAAVEGVEVWVSLGRAGLEAQGEAVLDPVPHGAVLVGLAAPRVTLRLLRRSVTHASAVALRVAPERLTGQMVAAFVIAATAGCLVHTPVKTV